jgi:hypothetical protein
MIEYTLNTRGASAVVLSVTYSGDDAGRKFAIYANDALVATQELVAEKRGDFVEKRYAIPAAVLAAAPGGRLAIRFAAPQGLAGGVYDVRLLDAGRLPPAN